MGDPLPAELLANALAGNRRAIAKILTHIERSRAGAERAVKALHQHSGNAIVVGVTGAPGSGKSALVTALAKMLRTLPLPSGALPQIAILAVDPSSPFTGGALLGDRVRMRELAGDAGIFIRSMASRGSLGGLAESTTAMVTALDAVGFDLILIETVGAGQAEVDIARAAPTTIVVEAPGMGDEVQSFKAGILEIADILVVNKADRPNAKQTVRGLQLMLSLNPTGTRVQASVENRWRLPLHQTVAIEGEGVNALVDSIYAHRAYLEESGELIAREAERSKRDVERLLVGHVMDELAEKMPAQKRNELIVAVAARQLDPYQAASRLYDTLQLLQFSNQQQLQ